MMNDQSIVALSDIGAAAPACAARDRRISRNEISNTILTYPYIQNVLFSESAETLSHDDESPNSTETLDEVGTCLSKAVGDVVISYTRYKNRRGPLAKTYHLENGKVVNKATASFYDGTAERRIVPFSTFTQELDASSDEANGYGLHSSNFSDTVTICLDGYDQPEAGVLSKTQRNFQYRNVSGVIMHDHDPSIYGKSMTPEKLIEVLAEIDPQVADCEYVIRASISAGVHEEGQPPSFDGAGFHLYIPVLDASDIPRYGAVMFKRLWKKGYGHIALSKNGAMLVRSVIDKAVYSGERLDFIGRPIVEEGLTFTPPRTSYRRGKAIDPRLLPDLTPEEEAEFEKQVNAAKRKIKPESEKKLTEWKRDKEQALVNAGVSKENAQLSIDRIVDSNFIDLDGNFLLEFPHGVFSVDYVIEHPGEFDGKALADPIEGAAYGKTTAKYWWNEGHPVIHSFAHGMNARYFLHPSKEPWQIALDQRVEELNQELASIAFQGKHRIRRREPGYATVDGLESFSYFPLEELARIYGNEFIKTGEKRTRGGGTVDVLENVIHAWHKHPKARSYRGGMVFLPNREAPEGYLNTWDGFAVDPVQNDVLITPILTHIHEVLCGGDDALNAYVLNWLATCFQKPGEPIGTVLVVRGKEGCGKGILGHFVRKLHGRHGLHVSNPRHVVGNFNKHLAEKCFVFLDEAFFAGDAAHESTLKALITEPVITIEPKGIDSYQQPNFLKLYLSTNSEWAVPASADARRPCVVDASSQRIGDREYFRDLIAAMESAEVQAAFLHAMLNRDLTGWHSGDIPESAGLRSQRFHSLPPHALWLLDALEAESFYALDRGIIKMPWVCDMTTDELFRCYSEWCRAANVGEYKRLSRTKLSSYLKGIYPKLGRVGHDGGRGFRLGSLDAARSAFEAHHRIKIDELV
jgi:hypothetical protein